ncbi:MAG: methylenetetrahydrofolate reductase [Lachnospiraceae bacterium]|nr:methylenetetrahydrofolate reductase [Lachnospiraceae bacterium]MBQ2454014.1 methylenetetrahydrofolate reductase [Lachnospiraceae bacterium]MBQ4243074.1 methylenetetrahydrofolate reductase [Lachnospiraceae bacterium]
MGSIRDKYVSGKTLFSCEVFPPKKDQIIEPTLQKLKEFRDISPDFLSVTYGAGGSNAGHAVEVASFIRKEIGVDVLSHITSVGFSREKLAAGLDVFRENGIENVLALRGDRPKYMSDEEYDSRDFEHASDMASYISEHHPEFTIAGACYPDKHFEAASYEEDILNLKKKTEAGCSFLISQLFFDNDRFYSMLERMKHTGINVPVSAGIMPVTSAKMLGTTVTLSGTSVPKALSDLIARYGEDDEAMKKAGIEYAIGQIRDLLDHGVNGIHVYAMNKPDIARQIFEAVR